MCENLYKTKNTIPRPIAKLILYIAAKNIKAIRIKFPKPVSNKLTKRLGTANMIIHMNISNVSNPTTKFKFFLEKTFSNERDILYYINLKKIENKALKINFI